MDTTENLKFDSARFKFFNRVVRVLLYLREVETVSMAVICWHLDWQVSSMAQISNSLGHVLSPVEHLTLEHKVHRRSSEEHDEVDRTEWRKLLRPFRSVKTLRIEKRLVEGLSRCLQLEDGELPLELLPELQWLSYPLDASYYDAFTSFINSRQNAGHAVTVTRTLW
jgi:hypothetical protein